ncbi:hypothetical protein SAMN05421833_13944 [Microbispora rosea]|jgi:hypothetical protein|uniref:Uncharacterized protein n=1 Tax=Microbispora rosea TaxID=58117 RepID=A0A1N7H8X6_9ACTN|nr:hypothetical protein SAMN05421833_13944 [Microbispora rosea]
MLGKTVVRLIVALALLTPVVALAGLAAGTPGISWT